MMFYFTIEGLKRAKEDLISLEAKYLEATDAFNQLEKNSDTSTSLELMNLNSCANSLNALRIKLEKPILIEETPEYKNWDGNTVIRKCELVLDFGGAQEVFKILGTNEGDFDTNILPCDAPLALVLIGRRIGDVVEFNGGKIVIKDVKPINNKKIDDIKTQNL